MKKKITLTRFKIGKDYIFKIFPKGYVYKIFPKLGKKKLKPYHHHSNQKDCILITARYRTGSSYFYSLFSSLKNTEVFYEPLHPSLIDTLDQNEEFHKQNKNKFSHTFKNKFSHTFQGKYFGEFAHLDRKRLESLAKIKTFGSCSFILDIRQ